MSLQHVVIDVDMFGQCQNGLTRMDHIILHTGHVHFWHFLCVFIPLSHSGLTNYV